MINKKGEMETCSFYEASDPAESNLDVEMTFLDIALQSKEFKGWNTFEKIFRNLLTAVK